MFTANFLWMCQGYYKHAQGYTPEWEGMEDFTGPIVHPQTWPEDLDYKGKNVVVIGSGATTATVVPAIAGDCNHVTVLQRSPTATHFTPKYRPWQQRLAFVPDGDMFQGIASGKASMVTDHIERFTEKGILLESGNVLEADIIVTATGFNLCVLGDIAFTVDEAPVDFADTVTYRGMMFSGVPNMLWILGYFRASWTLRVDLLGDFTCRLLNHMEKKGAKKVTPMLRPEAADMPLLPWIDPESFNPNYLTRSMHLCPSGAKSPNGSTRRTTEGSGTRSPPSTSTTPRFNTTERGPRGLRRERVDEEPRRGVPGVPR